MWFRNLFGFDEESPEQVRENLEVEGQFLVSKVNKARYQYGSLEIRSLDELRRQLLSLGATVEKGDADAGESSLALEQIVGDIRDVHCDSRNDGCVIQVASQFNMLEMIGPSVTPEAGVDIYEDDHTQGPVCAIACGAGTVFRNYFLPFEDGQIGQTRDKQIDCLEDIGSVLVNDGETLWEMRNGYMLADNKGLQQINAKLAGMTAEEIDRLRSRLKVGVQKDTEVTLGSCGNKVTQVYCSALPIAYCTAGMDEWEPFARLILEAAYEATFSVAAEKFLLETNPSSKQETRPKLYLTLLGCGAFGNREEWAMAAIQRAARVHQHYPMDVFIVRYS